MDVGLPARSARATASTSGARSRRRKEKRRTRRRFMIERSEARAQLPRSCIVARAAATADSLQWR